jgi:hypothetical protein
VVKNEGQSSIQKSSFGGYKFGQQSQEPKIDQAATFKSSSFGGYKFGSQTSDRPQPILTPKQGFSTYKFGTKTAPQPAQDLKSY